MDPITDGQTEGYEQSQPRRKAEAPITLPGGIQVESLDRLENFYAATRDVQREELRRLLRWVVGLSVTAALGAVGYLAAKVVFLWWVLPR